MFSYFTPRGRGAQLTPRFRSLEIENMIYSNYKIYIIKINGFKFKGSDERAVRSVPAPGIINHLFFIYSLYFRVKHDFATIYYILSFLIVSIIFCLLILFNEYLIIAPINANTTIIATMVGITGNLYDISSPWLKALYSKYEPNTPSGTPIKIAFVP